MRGMSVWQMRQANECPCGGSDEYCPCQNVDKMAIADRDVGDIIKASDEQVLAMKPCPFCGQPVVGPIEGRKGKWDFHCRGCGSIVQMGAFNVGQANQNWNTRFESGEDG